MKEADKKLKYKVKGQEIHGPDRFFYRTEDDPILLAALFELVHATGDREGYAEAIKDHAAKRPQPNKEGK